MRSLTRSCFIFFILFSICTKATDDSSENSPNKDKIRILAIDGGGIRGVIPAAILSEIEGELYNKLGCDISIAEYFDVVVGTSTGGIIALALSVPDENSVRPKYSAEHLVKLYLEKGTDIFPQQTYTPKILKQANGAAYDSKPLQEVIKAYLGDCTLSRACSRVFITSYNMTSNTIKYFDSNEAALGGNNDYNLSDVALATSAAPIYFSPHAINGEKYIDGAMFANNPALSAFVRLFSQNPDSDFLIISLGTGKYTDVPDKTVNGVSDGFIKWASEAPAVLMEGASDHNNATLSELEFALNSRKEKKLSYKRIQTNLPIGFTELDKPTIAKPLSIMAREQFKGSSHYKKIIFDIETFCRDGSLVKKRIDNIKKHINQAGHNSMDFYGIPLNIKINSIWLETISIEKSGYITNVNLRNTALGMRKDGKPENLLGILDILAKNLPNLTHLDMSENNFENHRNNINALTVFINKTTSLKNGQKNGLESIILMNCGIKHRGFDSILNELGSLRKKPSETFSLKKVDFQNRRLRKFPNIIEENELDRLTTKYGTVKEIIKFPSFK